MDSQIPTILDFIQLFVSSGFYANDLAVTCRRKHDESFLVGKLWTSTDLPMSGRFLKGIALATWTKTRSNASYSGLVCPSLAAISKDHGECHIRGSCQGVQ